MTNLFQTSGTEVFEWLLSLSRVRQTKLSSADARRPHSESSCARTHRTEGRLWKTPK